MSKSNAALTAWLIGGGGVFFGLLWALDQFVTR